MFEDAREGLEKAMTEKSAEQEAPAKDVSTSEQQVSETPKEQSKYIDLDSVERFKFNGKEWSPKDLKNSIMAHADYTKKTQAMAEEKKYSENFPYDLASVLENPKLFDQFKQLYPPQYVKVVQDKLSRFLSVEQKEEVKQQGLPPEVLAKLEKLDLLESDVKSFKEKEFEKEVATIEAQLDTVFTKNKEKYPFADEEAVIARAQALLDKGHKLDDKTWEQVFKTVHEKTKGFADSYYKEQTNKQKDAHLKGRDTGTGGGTLGQAPRKESIKEATARAIQELSGR